jgi:hypothetical protein
MSDSFSPLFAGRPSNGGSRSLRVQVLSAGGLTPLSAAPKHAPAETGPCAEGGAVKVSLDKQGDTVTGIRIECGCGQVIQLACVY